MSVHIQVLQDFIDGACSVARYEPDLSLNLEICELINKKQGTAPREAAMTIVGLVNSKHINQSMLALTLLDNCVKNCGYPFHLQIASKEFLNNLVRKFPERPTPFPNPVIQRILYMLKEWKVALADMSKHKDDLVHIGSMYRLLRLKGYRFPELRDSSVAALAPSSSLKSARELQEEDRLVQSAKLQELIRKGRPQDLVEANQLMKVMTGYDQHQQPDYDQTFEDELHKIQENAILLHEMLESVKPGESVNRNETIMELKNSTAVAQPKIQKLIQEEEDAEKIENLLTLNDMINNAMAKYTDIRKGIFNNDHTLKSVRQQNNEGSDSRQVISLIDFDDEISTTRQQQQQQPSNPTSKTNVMDELSDLFGQSISITASAPENAPQQQQNFDPLAALSSPSPLASTSTPFNLLSLPAPPLPQPPSSPSLSVSSMGSFMAFGANTLDALPPPQQEHQQLQSSIPSSTPKNDTRTVVHEPIKLLDKNGLQIVMDVRQADTLWAMRANFSNQSAAPMENVLLQLAVPKPMQLQMESQSSDILPPKTQNGVTQTIAVNNPKREPLRLRFKVTYQQFGVDMEQTGIGIDIVHLPRIAGLVARRGRGPLAKRILSATEHKEFLQRFPKDDQQMTEQVMYLGSRWCIKEAAYKALYPTHKLEWKQVTVAKEQGKPILKISKEIIGQTHVSLSHDKDYAIAQVIFEGPKLR